MLNGQWVRLRPNRTGALRRIARTSGVTVACAFAAAGVFGARINTTLSQPIGLYVRSSHPNSDLVEFCPPEPFATLSRARQYRPTGTCPDGHAPMLKSVIARPGDHVEAGAAGIAVNGRMLPNTAAVPRDSGGRPLAPYRPGHYVVASGTVWVASTYHPRSFDSRYFGPISITSIRGHLRPLITFQ
jgi:conjugative transfer signal peptidase TraF